jgi:adenine deaminase
MMPDQRLLDVAYGKAYADLVIANAQLVNVLTAEVYPADVAISGSRIAAVGDLGPRVGPDTEIIEAEDRYLVPGLMDGHLHVECSKLSITMFADAVVRFGTTSVISGLDQIYVVAGLDGVREFLDEAARSPLKVFWGAPFKAPYTLPVRLSASRLGPKNTRKHSSGRSAWGCGRPSRSSSRTATPTRSPP